MTSNPQQTIVLGQEQVSTPAASFELCAMRNELFGGVAVNAEPFEFEGRRICATWRQVDGSIGVMDCDAGHMLPADEAREVARRAGILRAIEAYADELGIS